MYTHVNITPLHSCNKVVHVNKTFNGQFTEINNHCILYSIVLRAGKVRTTLTNVVTTMDNACFLLSSVPSTFPQGVAVPDDISTFPCLCHSTSFHCTESTLALGTHSDHLPESPYCCCFWHCCWDLRGIKTMMAFA